VDVEHQRSGVDGTDGVPVIGFGPGDEEVAHGVGERVPIRHLVKAAPVLRGVSDDVSADTVTRR